MTVESEKMIAVVEVDDEWWVAVAVDAINLVDAKTSFLVIRSIEEDEYGSLDSFAPRGLLAWVEDWEKNGREPLETES